MLDAKELEVRASDMRDIDRRRKLEDIKLWIAGILATVASFILGAAVEDVFFESTFRGGSGRNSTYPYAAAIPFLGLAIHGRRRYSWIFLGSLIAFVFGFLLMTWEPSIGRGTYYGVQGEQRKGIYRGI